MEYRYVMALQARLCLCPAPDGVGRLFRRWSGGDSGHAPPCVGLEGCLVRLVFLGTSPTDSCADVQQHPCTLRDFLAVAASALNVTPDGDDEAACQGST